MRLSCGNKYLHAMPGLSFVIGPSATSGTAVRCDPRPYGRDDPSRVHDALYLRGLHHLSREARRHGDLRLANTGALSTSDIEGFVGALRGVVAELGHDPLCPA
ncbi:MAG: hypothetical protein AAFU79_14445 [Myxococcota bacterium]